VLSGLGFATSGYDWAVGYSGANTVILHWSGEGWS
jgi:hypothetical protein